MEMEIEWDGEDFVGNDEPKPLWTVVPSSADTKPSLMPY